MMEGEILSCENAAEDMKKYENAIASYQTAKSKGKKDKNLILERSEIDSEQELLNISQIGC